MTFIYKNNGQYSYVQGLLVDPDKLMLVPHFTVPIEAEIEADSILEADTIFNDLMQKQGKKLKATQGQIGVSIKKNDGNE